MKMRIGAVVALAGSLLLIPVLIDHANAGRGGGGRMGGMGGHIGGVGHIGGAHIGRVGGANISGGRIARANVGAWSGSRWHGGNVGARHWQGGSNWQGKNWSKNKFHDHRFNRRFVGVGLGWWPGYYGYNYGYGGCSYLRRQALATGSQYWWNRYYACVNYY
jgi:hypothetical protein